MTGVRDVCNFLLPECSAPNVKPHIRCHDPAWSQRAGFSKFTTGWPHCQPKAPQPTGISALHFTPKTYSSLGTQKDLKELFYLCGERRVEGYAHAQG